jgi:hypothetical protein
MIEHICNNHCVTTRLFSQKTNLRDNLSFISNHVSAKNQVCALDFKQDLNIEDGHEVLGPGDENLITLSLENDRTYLQQSLCDNETIVPVNQPDSQEVMGVLGTNE